MSMCWLDLTRMKWGERGVRLYYSSALLPYPRYSSQKLSAGRDRQYQFWNAPMSTKIHKRDLGISRENGTAWLDRSLEKQEGKQQESEIKMYLYVHYVDGRRKRKEEADIMHCAEGAKTGEWAISRDGVLFSNEKT